MHTYIIYEYIPSYSVHHCVLLQRWVAVILYCLLFVKSTLTYFSCKMSSIITPWTELLKRGDMEVKLGDFRFFI